MKNRLLAVPVLGALLAFGGVACSGGGDDTAQLDTWAKSVCDAAQDPLAQSRAAHADTAKVIQGEAPAELQKRLSADLAALAKSEQQLADVVDKAGAPKTDGGDSVRQGAVDALKQASQGYQEAQKKLDGLATTDQAKFADGLRSIGDQVQQLQQLSATGLGKLQTGASGDAIKKQPGCKADATASAGASAAPSGSADASPAPSASPSASASPTATTSSRTKASPRASHS